MDREAAGSIVRARPEEAGEGVISTAIAVLIMALIGGLMWVAFQGTFDGASQRVDDELEQIGS